MTNYNYIDIVNAVSAQTGGIYGYEFPIVDSTTFKAMAAALIEAPSNIMNAYVDNMRNLMCNLLIKKVYRSNNPFKKLYRDETFMSADGYQYTTEVAIDQFEPLAYEITSDPSNFFKSRPPQVKVQFLCNCLRKKYEITINSDILVSAFESEAQFGSFFTSCMDRLYSDMEEDDKEEIMAAIDGVIEGGNIRLVPMTRPVDSSTALEFSKNLDVISRDLSFRRRRDFNLQHLATKTTEGDCVLIVSGDVVAVQNNYNLAWAFNRGYLDLLNKGQLIVTDSQGLAGNKVFGIYTDIDWFRIHPAKGFPKLKAWENGDNLEEKRWLHSWKMVNFSYAANALAFCEPEDIGVESVEILTKDGKNTATCKPGKFLTLGLPKVTPTDGKICDCFVEYDMSGAESVDTRIDKDTGTLYVASDETASEIVITAVSHLDASKRDSLVVTVG